MLAKERAWRESNSYKCSHSRAWCEMRSPPEQRYDTLYPSAKHLWATSVYKALRSRLQPASPQLVPSNKTAQKTGSCSSKMAWKQLLRKALSRQLEIGQRRSSAAAWACSFNCRVINQNLSSEYIAAWAYSFVQRGTNPILSSNGAF